MTEYLPFIYIAFAAVMAVTIINQAQRAKGETDGSGESFKYSMPILATRTALEQILTEPFQCDGVERYWGPAETIESGDGILSLKYKIHYEFTTTPGEQGLRERQLTSLILRVKLKQETEGTTVQFSFEDEEKYVFGESSESKLLKSLTLNRLTTRLAQASIEQRG